MSIHKQAVETNGKDERIEKLTEELVEAVHAIIRYRSEKGTADEVVNEIFDVLYVAKSLQHIEGFERYNEREQVRHSIQADYKLKAAMGEVIVRDVMADAVGDGDA